MTRAWTPGLLSIVIPTWNNWSLLQLCLEGIKRHTTCPHQVVLHVNEGVDGTLEWVRSQGIAHTWSEQNVGICHAMNRAVALSSGEYILYLNDDMFCCPGWDQALMKRISLLGTSAFMLSGTMIEPRASGNPCVVVKNFGSDPENFQMQRLIEETAQLYRPDWYGATWPPTCVHREWWDRVGGYSEEFSPGMSSDNDFSMKMWQAGCRIFQGVGDSLVYHFMSRSTGKVIKNDGRKQFLKKWGITQSSFDRHYLRRGLPLERFQLPEPEHSLHWYWDLFRGNLKKRIT